MSLDELVYAKWGEWVVYAHEAQFTKVYADIFKSPRSLNRGPIIKNPLMNTANNGATTTRSLCLCLFLYLG